MRNPHIQKNLLDLEYGKQLQYLTTSLIVLFTYVIGIVIAFFTRQIAYINAPQLFALGVISMLVMICTTLFVANAQSRMRMIVKEIKQLGR